MRDGWVFLCPGQGSQSVGMGRGLHDAYPRARELYAAADAAVDVTLSKIAFEGPEEELRKTLNTQPALFTLDVICAELLREGGVRPVATAGHSLGEYAACVVAGALDYEDGVRLTRLRGELMYDAGVTRPGAMAAVLGLEESTIRSVLETVEGTVQPANLNTATQIVISGDTEAVDAALPLLKEAGAKRAMRLPVSGAFHSPLMEPAAQGLAEALNRTQFRDAEIPIIANVTGGAVQGAEEIRRALIAQLTAQVRWLDSMRWLLDHGYTRFVETGPGRALQGMLRQIDRSAIAHGVDSPEGLKSFLAEQAQASET